MAAEFHLRINLPIAFFTKRLMMQGAFRKYQNQCSQEPSRENSLTDSRQIT